MSTTLPIEESQGVGAGTVSIDERRSSYRAPRRITAYVTALGQMEGECCTTENLSAEGLFAIAPPGSKLQVGQRCEVVLRDEPGATLWPSYSDTGCYATIIHTRAVPHGGTTFLGVGMRFDQPFYW